jgi:hypothetical protein
MRSTIRQISATILLTVLLAPGLLHARTPVRHQAQASVRTSVSPSGMLDSVWNLLTGLLKTGGQLDPAGTPPPPSGSSATTGDTGGQLDPAGHA